MRPPHLRLPAVCGARAPAKLLLPLLIAQLWGEGDMAWREGPGTGETGGCASTTNPAAPLLSSGSRAPTHHPEQAPPTPALLRGPGGATPARRRGPGGPPPPGPRPFTLQDLNLPAPRILSPPLVPHFSNPVPSLSPLLAPPILASLVLAFSAMALFPSPQHRATRRRFPSPPPGCQAARRSRPLSAPLRARPAPSPAFPPRPHPFSLSRRCSPPTSGRTSAFLSPIALRGQSP